MKDENVDTGAVVFIILMQDLLLLQSAGQSELRLLTMAGATGRLAPERHAAANFQHWSHPRRGHRY